MKLIGSCGSYAPSAQATCDACGRRIKCVYVVDDMGWIFTMGRRCFERLQSWLRVAA